MPMATYECCSNGSCFYFSCGKTNLIPSNLIVLSVNLAVDLTVDDVDDIKFNGSTLLGDLFVIQVVEVTRQTLVEGGSGT